MSDRRISEVMTPEEITQHTQLLDEAHELSRRARQMIKQADEMFRQATVMRINARSRESLKNRKSYPTGASCEINQDG